MSQKAPIFISYDLIDNLMDLGKVNIQDHVVHVAFISRVSEFSNCKMTA